MEKSGEKMIWNFWQDELLAGRNDKRLQIRFAERTHEYREAIRMVFQSKVVKNIHCSVLKDQTFKLNSNTQNIFGDDAPRGHTRSHSEHDG